MAFADLVGGLLWHELPAARPPKPPIERVSEVIQTATPTIQVIWNVTSLRAERAGPDELLALKGVSRLWRK